VLYSCLYGLVSLLKSRLRLYFVRVCFYVFICLFNKCKKCQRVYFCWSYKLRLWQGTRCILLYYYTFPNKSILLNTAAVWTPIVKHRNIISIYITYFLTLRKTNAYTLYVYMYMYVPIHFHMFHVTKKFWVISHFLSRIWR
jgi:hypothetical protein